MNFDDHNVPIEPDALERRILGTPLKAPPAGWKAEILARALAEEPATASSAPKTVRREQRPFAGWLEWIPDWLRAVPAEWAAVAALVLLAVGLNWSLADGAESGVSVARGSLRDGPTIEGAIYLMASRESLMRELGLTEEAAPGPGPASTARPAENRPRRQLNQSGTNDVALGWV